MYSGAVRGARAQPQGAEGAPPAKSSPGESEAAGRRAAAEVGPPDYGPQGVRDSFTLNEGQGMLSYRFVGTFMDDNRSGQKRLDASEVFAKGFSLVPTRLDARLHLIGGMYAPHDRLTFSVHLPVFDLEMRYRNESGPNFTTRSSGVGDLQVTGLVPFMKKGQETLHLHLGLSIPTGSILVDEGTPLGKLRLPYSMQLGSGTWDVMPGGTYRGQKGRGSWGLQATGVLHLGKNDLGYSLGDRYEITGWLGWHFRRWLDLSFRLAWNDWGNVKGRDPDLVETRSPVEDADRQEGERLDLGPELRLTLPGLPGQQLSIETLFPVYQHLDGPQIETDWILSAGWQWVF
ncbi:MAG: transporter [Myxococcota bacterium]